FAAIAAENRGPWASGGRGPAGGANSLWPLAYGSPRCPRRPAPNSSVAPIVHSPLARRWTYPRFRPGRRKASFLRAAIWRRLPRLVKEDKGPAPTFVLPPGPYIVSAGFGLASVTRAVQVRAETMKDVFEIPAGGLRIEGRVGNARIPQGQISFDLYKGSQFEPGDKRPSATAIMTGDIVLLPEGAYHIVSNYGDANATVRSDIRVEVGKLTDATIN